VIRGVGIEVVDVARFRAAMERWGERLTERLFTRAELEYCSSQRRPEVHLSARFASKISLFKALGRTMRFTDVEICRTDDGRPCVRAVGLDDRLSIALSISHERGLAVAGTIVEEAVT